MTNQEKIDEIMGVCCPEKNTQKRNEELLITFFVCYHLIRLSEKDLIDFRLDHYEITEEAKRTMSRCDEFNWSPSDDQILKFLNENEEFENADKEHFFELIKLCREKQI